MLLSQTKFALDLLRENEIQSSTIISPLSISIALDLALIGAKNDTAVEIQRVIGEQVTTQEIHQYLSYFLLTSFPGVKFANKIFCVDEPLDSYKSELQNHYNQILIETINFKDTQKAVDIINNFVSNNTDNEIKNMVDADSLKANIRMMLINVLKFEMMWKYPFTVHSPYSVDFYSKSNITTKTKTDCNIISAATVQILRHERMYPYYETTTFQLVTLPYKDSLFSMYFILPRERFGLSDLLKNLSVSDLQNAMSNTTTDNIVQIYIPKFEFQSSFDLTKILKKLGIKNAFESDRADFSNLSKESLHISSVLHKSIITVDEMGTKAAAATVELIYPCKFSVWPKIIEFQADHPFLFLIADEEKNIYFVGTFYNL